MNTVEQFIDTYINTTASFTLSGFHTNCGDLEVELPDWSDDKISTWKGGVIPTSTPAIASSVSNVSNAASDSDSNGLYRGMKFLKIVNIPGLKSTTGTKFQYWRNFKCTNTNSNSNSNTKGETTSDSESLIGFIMYSSTITYDVPYATSFSVDESFIVKRLGEHEGISLSIHIEVKWTKSCMLKYVIDGSSVSETTRFLQDYVEGIRKVSIYVYVYIYLCLYIDRTMRKLMYIEVCGIIC